MLAGRDGMVHYGQLVPRGLYGWGGYGGSVFLWDPAREVGFAYIPTYLAWWVQRQESRLESLAASPGTTGRSSEPPGCSPRSTPASKHRTDPAPSNNQEVKFDYKHQAVAPHRYKLWQSPRR